MCVGEPKEREFCFNARLEIHFVSMCAALGLTQWTCPFIYKLSPTLHECPESRWNTKRSAACLTSLQTKHLQWMHMDPHEDSMHPAALLSRSSMLQAMVQFLFWEYVLPELHLCRLKLHFYRFHHTVHTHWKSCQSSEVNC